MHLPSVFGSGLLLAFSATALPITQCSKAHLLYEPSKADSVFLIADDVLAEPGLQDESKSWAGPLTDFEDAFPPEKRAIETSKPNAPPLQESKT